MDEANETNANSSDTAMIAGLASSYKLWFDGQLHDVSNLACPIIKDDRLYPDVSSTLSTSNDCILDDERFMWEWSETWLIEETEKGIERSKTTGKEDSNSTNQSNAGIHVGRTPLTQSHPTTQTDPAYLRVDLDLDGNPLIEIGDDTKVPYVGSKSKTKAALNHKDKILALECPNCSEFMVCMTGLQYVLCSTCLVVSPALQDTAATSSLHHGVGIGLAGVCQGEIIPKAA